MRERESKRGREEERRRRGISEGEESRLRVVKNEPTGETFFFMSRKILLKTRGGKWRECFMPFDCPQAQRTLDGKWKLIYTAPKLLRGREGGKSCETLSQSQGKRCPCPSSGSRVVLSLQHHLSPVTPRKP